MTDITNGLPTNLKLIYENGVLNVTWDASAIPTGYTVVVDVSDSSSQSLNPAPNVVVNNTGNGATISGPAILPGILIIVKLRIQSPWAGSVEITPVTLEVIEKPILQFTGAGLSVDWAEAANAVDYQLEFADANGTPYAPQPPFLLQEMPGQPSRQQALIALNDVLDKTVYKIRVRAVAESSFGPWSEAAEIEIDKTRPESLLLQALLARLKAAGQSFDLDSTVIGASHITNQFANLLDVEGGKLAVADAQVTSNINSVTMTAKLDLLGTSGATGTFRFIDTRNIIHLELSYPLGTTSVAQLKDDGILPPDVFGDTNWADNLAAFAGLTLNLTTANRLLSITSDTGVTWSIFGLPDVSLGPVKPNFQVTAPLPGEYPTYIPRVEADLQLSQLHTISVYVQLPAGNTPWEAGLKAPLYIGNIDDLNALFGGQNLNLPSGLVALTQFTLNTLRVTYVPNSSIWRWDVVCILGPKPGEDPTQVPSWDIIDGVLSIRSIGVQLHADIFSTGIDAQRQWRSSISGSLAGQFKLKDYYLDVVVSVPGESGLWTLYAQASKVMPLSEMSQLLGNSDTALDNTLGNVGTASGFTLNGLTVVFDPTPSNARLERLSCSFAIDNWSIPSLDWFQAEHIGVEFQVIKPADATNRIITGAINAIITLGSIQVNTITSFDESSIWRLKIATMPARLTGLSDLSHLVGTDAIKGGVPQNLPTNGGFEMAEFGFTYDGGPNQGYFVQINFALKSELDWAITNLFTLRGINIALEVTKANKQADSVITGKIAGTITVAGADFELSASKPAVGDNWTLRGELQKQVTIDFNKLLQNLISPQWSIPSGYGMPTALTIVAADAAMVPDTGTFDLDCYALIDWSFDFGAAIFYIRSLGGSIHRAGIGDKVPSNATLYGTFTFGENVSGDAFVQLGEGNFDTIIQVEVSDKTKLEPSTTIASIIGGTDPVGNIQKPSDFLSPGTFEAGIILNLSKNIFLAWGEIVLGDENAMYGRVAMLVQKRIPADGDPTDQSTWNFILTASLKNWTFARISAALSPVDAVLSIDTVSLAIANFEIDSQIAPFDKLQLADASGTRLVKPGLNLYAHLSFHTPLLQNVASLLINIDQSVIELYALIGQKAEDTIFTAELGNFTVFQIIQFTSLRLEYQPSVDIKTPQAPVSGGQLLTTPVLRVIGQANVTIPLKGGVDKSCQFNGTLTIDNTKALFAIATPSDQEITAPLGMFGITLSQLSLAIYHTFGVNAPPTVIELSGQVGFGKLADGTPQLVLKGKILWVNWSPVLVDIELAQPLGLIAFFTSVFTNATYPSEYIDILLKEGRIYYYKSSDSLALTYQGFSYKPYFNVHTVISMFDIDVTLDIQVFNEQTIEGLTGSQSGFIATGSFSTPITLWFMTLSDKTFATSPALELQILTSRKAFGLEIGFSFFNEHFATGSVTIGKTEGQQDAQLVAEFTYAGDIAILKNAQIAFTYSESVGFNLTKLPFQSEIALDLAKLLQVLSSLQGGCADIVSAGFDQLVKTNFFIKPSMTDQGDDALHVTLNGIYAISLIGVSQPFLYVDMPQITLTITKENNLTLSRLPGYLIEQVVANSGNIVQQLLNQPAKLSAFLSVVGAQALAKGIITNLLCDMETVPEDAAAAEEAAQAAEAAEEAANALEAAEEAGATAEEIAELAAAAAEAAEAAMAAGAAAGIGVEGAGVVSAGVIAVIGAGIGGVLGGFIGSLFGGSGSNPSGPNTGSSSGSSNPPPQPRPQLGTVSNIQFPPQNSDTLRVVWNAVSNAQYYKITLKDGGSNLNQVIGGTQVDFSVVNLAPGQYTVEIIAYASDYKPSDSVSSQSFWKVAPPSLQPLHLNGQTITATLAQIQPGGEGYQAQLLVDGIPNGTIQTLSGNPLQTQFTISNMNARYSVSVQSLVSQGIPSTWSTSTNSIAPLALPGLPFLVFANNNLTVTLSGVVTGADAYQAQLVEDGIPLRDILPMLAATDGSTNFEAQFQISSETTGTRYQVQVQALGSNAFPSPWSISTDSITRLVAPELQSLTNVANVIKIALAGAATGADNYQAQLIADGSPIGNPIPMVPTESVPSVFQAQFIIASSFPGTTFQVRVQALGGNHLPSVWKISADSLTRLASPVLKPLSLSGRIITVLLQDSVPGADTYQAQLVVDGTPVGQPTPMTASEVAPPVIQAQFTIDETIPGLLFQVQVQALGTDHLPTVAVISLDSIARLAQPIMQPLAVSGSTITVSLQNITPDAATYQAQLVVDGQPIGQLIPMTASQAAPHDIQAQLIIDESLPGSTFQVRVWASRTNYLTSAWATSTDSITRLLEPEIGSPLLHIGGMLINIQTTVPGAESYQARLVIDGVPQETTVDVSAATAGVSYSAAFTITDTTPGTDFKVQARALSANTLPSLWATGAAGVTRLASPEVQSLTFDEVTGKLIIILANAIPDATNYETQLVVDGTAQTYYGSTENDPAIPQPRFAILMNPQISGVQFQVRARATGGGHLSSNWKVSPQSLTKLGDPQFGPLGLLRNTLVAQLIAQSVGAENYQTILLIDGASSSDPEPMTPSPDNPDVLQATFPVTIDTDQPVGMQYQVQVRAFAAGCLPSSYILSPIMNRLDAPEQQPLQYENEKLLAKLSNTVANAEYYQACLVMSGSALDAMSTMQQSVEDPAQYFAEFSISNAAADLNYQVQVRAMATNYLPSIWKISLDSLTIIGVPQGIKLTLNDQKDAVEVSWDTVTNATDYEVRITDAAGNPLSDQPVFTAKDSQNNIVTWEFAIMANFLASGIQAQVRAKATNQVSVWSRFSEVFILPSLKAPNNVQLGYANNVFTITWDDANEGVDYEVQLLIGDQQNILDPQPDAEFAGKKATIAASAVAGGTIVHARVRALEAQFRSLLKNGDAADGFDNWQILMNGGDQWQVEDGPATSCPGTEGTTNFVTSYEWDKKAQTIDLLAEGLEQAYLDTAPDIQISEWMCSRSDCQGQYQLIVELRDADQKVIQRFDTGVIEAPIAPNWIYPWKKVSHQFVDYGTGLRFVYFEHSGKDMNWWAGYYGSKMTGGRVLIKLPHSGPIKTSDWSAISNAFVIPTPEVIVSVTPAAQVAAGFGQLLLIRGIKLPDVVVFSQGGQEYMPQWTASTGSEVALVRLPLELQPGAATVRLTDTARSVTTPDFPITISDTPGAPVITAVTTYPEMIPITKVSPGLQIAIHAEGMDTSGAIIEWIHPNQAALTSSSEFTVGVPNGADLSVVTTVPNIMPNDTWSLSLRVGVNSKLSAACLWSLLT